MLGYGIWSLIPKSGRDIIERYFVKNMVEIYIWKRDIYGIYLVKI